MNVWYDNIRQAIKKGTFMRRKNLPDESTLFGSIRNLHNYTPSIKVSSTCGSSLLLYSDREKLPLNSAQSYKSARSYMA